MPEFSNRSRQRLATCRPEIQRVFGKVIQVVDCSILEGHRNKERQDLMLAKRQSKVPWPKSYHNREPSDAVDAIPWPIDWSFEQELLWAVQRGNRKAVKRIMHAIQRWAMFIGYVLGVADEMGIRLVSGSDWDRDFDLADQNFDDWPHFQLEG